MPDPCTLPWLGFLVLPLFFGFCHILVLMPISSLELLSPAIVLLVLEVCHCSPFSHIYPPTADGRMAVGGWEEGVSQACLAI